MKETIEQSQEVKRQWRKMLRQHNKQGIYHHYRWGLSWYHMNIMSDYFTRGE